MTNNENGKYEKPIPKTILFIVDREEEINVARYPELAAGKDDFNRSRNIPCNLVIIDGPEEIRT